MVFVKLNAGALQLTIFMVTVIAVLLASFLVLTQLQQRFKIKTNLIIKTVHNANVGFGYALANTIPLNDTTIVDLENEDYKSVKLHREFWGVFEKVGVVSDIKANRFKKVALIGTKQNEANRTALYLEDQNKPLTVVGNTKIKGNAYLPKRGIRTGNISGVSYYGSQLVYGTTQNSGAMPKLGNETMEQLESISNNKGMMDQDRFLDIKGKKEVKNSFLEPYTLVYDQNEILLSEIKLTGHIMVQSQTKITVDSSAHLKDVLLVAPNIEIRDNVSGTFQAIGTGHITVGKNCQFSYPSALVIYEKSNMEHQEADKQTEKNGIVIDKASTFKGMLVYLGNSKPNNYEPQLVIEENTNVIGEIYCNQNVELRGNVFGTIYASNFVARQSGSIYQNHIYNGVINIEELPLQYNGLTFEKSKKGVMTWLY